MAREPSAASAIAWIVPAARVRPPSVSASPASPQLTAMMSAACQRFRTRGAASPSSRAPGRDGEGQPGGSSDGHALEPASDVEVEAHQRGEAPAGQPLDRGADEAAAQRRRRTSGRARAVRARPPRRTRGPRRRRRRPARRSRRRSPPGPERWRSGRCCPAWRRGSARRRHRPRSRPGRRPPRPRSILSRRTARRAAAAATAVRRSAPAARPLRPAGPIGPRGVVLFLDHLGMDELVAVARDGADEARLARVVAERAADGAHGLAERALRHDDVGPDAIEDLAAMHRLAAALDQQEQEIEIPRDERHLASVPEEEPPLR